jgi:hypothetical protein
LCVWCRSVIAADDSVLQGSYSASVFFFETDREIVALLGPEDEKITILRNRELVALLGPEDEKNHDPSKRRLFYQPSRPTHPQYSKSTEKTFRFLRVHRGCSVTKIHFCTQESTL